MILRLLLLACLLIPTHSLAAVAFGTIGAGAGGTNSAAPGYPASIAANDLLVLCVAHKYPAAPSSVSTPAGWTAPSNNIGRGDDALGTGVNDQGETAATMFYKLATGSESGTLTLTVTSGNAAYAWIARYTNATGAWLAAAAQGGDASRGANWSATMGTDPGITTGDMVVSCAARSEGSVVSAASEAIAATGLTVGTQAERGDNGTSFGDNVGAVISDHAITTGPASDVVTYTFTSATSSSGGTVILRIREDAAPGTALQSNTFLGAIIQ